MTSHAAGQLQTRIEQMLAYGRSDTYIRANLHVTPDQIDKTRRRLETINNEPDTVPADLAAYGKTG